MRWGKWVSGKDGKGVVGEGRGEGLREEIKGLKKGSWREGRKGRAEGERGIGRVVKSGLKKTGKRKGVIIRIMKAKKGNGEVKGRK